MENTGIFFTPQMYANVRIVQFWIPYGHHVNNEYTDLCIVSKRKDKMIMKRFIINTIREKCPFCEKGDVFIKRKFFLQPPKMYSNCEVCGRDFDGEPGYYFGAMYVSYAIAVAAGIATFIAARFIFGITSFDATVAWIAAVIFLISYKNFKWSRIIWLRIFPPGEGTNFFGGGNVRKTQDSGRRTGDRMKTQDSGRRRMTE